MLTPLLSVFIKPVQMQSFQELIHPDIADTLPTVSDIHCDTPITRGDKMVRIGGKYHLYIAEQSW